MDKEAISKIEKKTGHALFSPSQLSRIMACPASAQEATRAPVQVSSSYARHGSMLHDIVANLAFSEFTGDLNIHPSLSKLDLMDVNYVLDCLEYLNARRHNIGDHTMLVEEPVSLGSWGLGEIWGTADIQLISEQVFHVIDWKFGSGVQVFAQNNEQAMCYAAGAVGFPSDVKEVVIHVVQPPLNHFDEWVISYDELKDWVFTTLEPAILAAKSPNPGFNPGTKQCRFCPAGTQCRARDDSAMESAKDIFRVFSEMPTVTPADLVRSYKAIDEVTAYAKDIMNFFTQELTKGREIPGFKLVSGRSIRKWKEEEDAEHFLMSYTDIPDKKMFTQKFISPAQAEKIDRTLKKNSDFKDLITKPAGKPQIVTDDDPRPALEPADAETVFADHKE